MSFGVGKAQQFWCLVPSGHGMVKLLCVRLLFPALCYAGLLCTREKRAAAWGLNSDPNLSICFSGNWSAVAFRIKLLFSKRTIL